MEVEKMQTIEILNALQKDGVLRRLVRDGFISTKTPVHLEAYLEYDKQKRTTKKDNRDIISEVSETFKISEKHFYKIVKKLRPNAQNRGTDTE
jgi:hypothetical protein